MARTDRPTVAAAPSPTHPAVTAGTPPPAPPPPVPFAQFRHAYRAQIARRDQIEIDFHGALARVFARRQRTVARRLRAIRKTLVVDVPLTAAAPPAPALRASEVFMDGFDDDLEEEMEPVLERHTAEVGGALIGAALFGGRRKLNSMARRHVDQQLAHLSYVTDRANTAVEGALADSFRSGQDFDSMAQKVGDVFDSLAGRSAGLIARVEAVAVVAGAATVAGRLGQVKAKRIWITQEDERVRPTHEAAHGQEVGLDEPFLIGEALLDYPGDPNGPDEEVLNCRCEISFLEPDDEPNVEAEAEDIEALLE